MLFISLLFSLTTAFAQDAAPAAEEEVDFFKVTLERWGAECKDHFDIKQYASIGISGTPEEPVPPELQATRQKFMATGHLELPVDKVNDPVAQRCAVLAEGLMLGGVGHQFREAFIKSMSEGGTATGRALADTLKANSPQK